MENSSFNNELCVHIILVNYNGAKDTIECLESIMQSDYKNVHIDIVDNRSTDASVVVIKAACKYNNVTIIENENNLGFAIANNIGIKFAISQHADYIILLNNDTIVDNKAISNLILKAKFNKNKNVYTGKIMYYSTSDIIWYAGGKYNRWKGTAYHLGCNEKDCGQFDISYNVGFATGCYIMIKASDIAIVGFMPEEYFLYSEDVAYSLQILEHGYKILYEPSSVIYHKVSASVSKISNMSSYYISRNRLIIIKKYCKGLQKLSAYIYSYLVFIKALIYKKVSIKVLVQANIDFIKKRYGKR